MIKYSQSSPYFNTKLGSQNLGYFSIRPVPEEPDDPLYTIEPQYTHRPDLLAYDLYDDPKLWWIFAQRNMDIIKDPIFDFVPGTKIYLPKPNRVKTVLGA